MPPPTQWDPFNNASFGTFCIQIGQLLEPHCTVVEGAEKSQNYFLAFSGRFGYEKTDGRGIFHEFDQNNGFSCL